MTERRGIKRKGLLHDHKEMWGYWKLEEKALDLTLCKLALKEAMDLP